MDEPSTGRGRSLYVAGRRGPKGTRVIRGAGPCLRRWARPLRASHDYRPGETLRVRLLLQREGQVSARRLGYVTAATARAAYPRRATLARVAHSPGEAYRATELLGLTEHEAG